MKKNAKTSHIVLERTQTKFQLKQLNSKSIPNQDLFQARFSIIIIMADLASIPAWFESQKDSSKLILKGA